MVAILHFDSHPHVASEHAQCVYRIASMWNKFIVTPLLIQYPIYKHLALGLGACKLDIALAGVFMGILGVL